MDDKNSLEGLKKGMDSAITTDKIKQLMAKYLMEIASHIDPEAGVEITLMLSHPDHKKLPFVATASTTSKDIPLPELITRIQNLIDSGGHQKASTVAVVEYKGGSNVHGL